MQIKLPLLFSVLVLSLSCPVFAQQKGADAPAAPSTIRGAALRGFELGLRPAYGSAGGGSPVTYDPAPLALHPDPGGVYSGDATPYGAGFAGEALVGYRFAPFASAGASGCLKERVSTALGDVSASSCTDASDAQRVTQADSYGVWSAGLDLRLTL